MCVVLLCVCVCLCALLIGQLCERHIVQIVLDLLHLQQEDVLVAIERYHIIINFRRNPARDTLISYAVQRIDSSVYI